MTSRWSVCKRDGQWRIYDGGTWHESHPSLVEAHTAATQLAITTEVFQPGWLTYYKLLIWAALPVITPLVERAPL